MKRTAKIATLAICGGMAACGAGLSAALLRLRAGRGPNKLVWPAISRAETGSALRDGGRFDSPCCSRPRCMENTCWQRGATPRLVLVDPPARGTRDR